ncbi:biotin--[acetyl-CoA-carboxylase] ligase, partial [Alistipes putredinis]|nr:biotin--[acetyl-CoA-carboxylase] ligase [Alistipes putredinis]
GDRLSRTIVGLGGDVNQTRFDPSLPNPSSMCLETGCEYDRQEVLHRLGDCLAARYEQLEKGDREALQAD